MNKKVLVVLMVLVLAVAGLSAKGSVKAGAQLGWGFDTGSMKCSDDEDTQHTYQAKNNGFAFALTGEYAFDKNWSVKANFGLMAAGKAKVGYKSDSRSEEYKSGERSGVYFDVAIDAKYTYAINKQISVAGFAGFELVSGQLLRGFTTMGMGVDDDLTKDSTYANVGFGVNLGVEGAYQLTNEVAITAGFSGAILFANSFSSSKLVTYLKAAGSDASIISFYLRPYVGATYTF